MTLASRTRRLCRAVVHGAVALLASRAALAEDPRPPSTVLAAFPVVVDPSVSAGHVALSLRTDATTFGELSSRHLGSPKERQLLVALGDYPRSSDKVTRAHRACSFLVDCDEPVVVAAFDGAQAELGAHPGIDVLTAWVSRFITTKSSARGFDVASEVVRRREGDCTEHAVLLAALARHHGIPARVVTGLVLLEAGGRTAGAFGHAWVEVHDGKRWLPADAALSAEELSRVSGAAAQVSLHYLPVQVVGREDAGFRAGMIQGHGVLEIAEVHVDR